MLRRFAEIDVFTTTRYGGNPVAVVLDSAGLDTPAMQRFAHWTNLSETTFVLPPSRGGTARARIFTLADRSDRKSLRQYRREIFK